MSPSLGVQGTSYLKPHEKLITVSFRSLHSFRDFQGSKKLPVPSPPEIYANTHVYTFDIAATYAATKRLSFTLELPIQHGSRETYYEHDGATLHTMRANGVGDLKVTGNLWLLDPSCHQNGNISLGLGLKAPTGNSGARDYSYRTPDSIIHSYKLGETPEEIADNFPPIALADVYAAITYYLTHREEVEEYLRQREREDDAVQGRLESDPKYQAEKAEMRERLLARWSERQSKGD